VGSSLLFMLVMIRIEIMLVWDMRLVILIEDVVKVHYYYRTK